uniref:Uncharacterized protein n=1 Tax=Rhizophora mucronata TaxID=61149 RepID=A0A2P2K8M9_RHIMU
MFQVYPENISVMSKSSKLTYLFQESLAPIT